MRWLALVLPRLGPDRLRRVGSAPAQRPLALYQKVGSTFVLTAVDAWARQAGLSVGMALADARAMRPDLFAAEHDWAADGALLDRLAEWCGRYTPCVVVDGRDGLFLDVSGAAHLFGGEEALLADLCERVRRAGFAAAAALAPTPGAAWALARWRPGVILSELGDIPAALAPLPVEALQLQPQAARFLRRVGLVRVGQIAGAPRAVLTARAGRHAQERLDAAFGRRQEALAPRRPPPPITAFRRLMEPVFQTEAVLQVAQALLSEALVALEERGAGLKLAELRFFGVDGVDRVLRLGLSAPSRELPSLLRLTREKLERACGGLDERLTGDFGFEAARLDVLLLERIESRDSVFSALVDDGGRQVELAPLIDLLSARLGAERVMRGRLANSFYPERAGVFVPALKAAATCDRGLTERLVADAGAPEDSVMRRPLFAFEHAQPFEAIALAPDGPPLRMRWRKFARRVRRAEGAERVGGDWLAGEEGAARDYFRAEDEQGRRYWLFRAGAYGDAPAPRWFVHGCFA